MCQGSQSCLDKDSECEAPTFIFFSTSKGTLPCLLCWHKVWNPLDQPLLRETLGLRGSGVSYRAGIPWFRVCWELVRNLPTLTTIPCQSYLLVWSSSRSRLSAGSSGDCCRCRGMPWYAVFANSHGINLPAIANITGFLQIPS